MTDNNLINNNLKWNNHWICYGEKDLSDITLYDLSLIHI